MEERGASFPALLSTDRRKYYQETGDPLPSVSHDNFIGEFV